MMMMMMMMWKELSKRLEWEPRQIERWWRRRRTQGKMSEIQRFRETRFVLMNLLFVYRYQSSLLSLSSLSLIAVIVCVENVFGARAYVLFLIKTIWVKLRPRGHMWVTYVTWHSRRRGLQSPVIAAAQPFYCLVLIIVIIIVIFVE